MNNKKAKNVKWGGKNLRIRKPQSTKRFKKLVWKIHGIVGDKGLLSWNWDVPHVKLVSEESWTNLEWSWNC
jgi:hypothetical protein